MQKFIAEGVEAHTHFTDVERNQPLRESLTPGRMESFGLKSCMQNSSVQIM